jgi:hypothetical protein
MKIRIRSSRTFVVRYFLRTLVDDQVSQTSQTLTTMRNFARRNRPRKVGYKKIPMNDGLISDGGTNREPQMIACSAQDRIAGNKPIILLPDELNDLELTMLPLV